MKKKKKSGVKIIYNKGKHSHKILLGIPTIGRIRFEWAAARYGQIVPINFQLSEFAITYHKINEIFPSCVPIGFQVADAYNVIIKNLLDGGHEWLLCIEDDVLVPPDLFCKVRKYVEKADIPVVSGLYYIKADPCEPLIFRGRGNGAFHDWRLGQKVWADGVPMGCLLIHASILRYMWDNSEAYKLSDGTVVKKVFETPRLKWVDPQTGKYNTQVGTQDLFWCDRIIKEKVLQKTGWGKIAKKKYPFLVDTTIFCKHIDINTGKQFP